MNQQPPYGNPTPWGQQGNPANPPQYPVQHNPYAPQSGYPQMGQQPPQQNWQPQQGYSQPYAPVETYQQQPHPQQPVYQQQSWQPYQQPYQQQYQQPQQGNYPPQGGYQQPQPMQQPYYGQAPQGNPAGNQGYVYPQGYQQQPQQAYPQFNQMGQQVQPGAGGYTGFHSQPQEKKFEIPLDVAGKVLLYGVLPLFFILAMVFTAPALKWIFLAGAVGGIVLMWMKDIVTPNMRLTLSLVYGVMAVVALVGALNGQPAQTQNNNLPGQSNVNNPQNQTVQQQNNTTPTMQPTATPAPEDAADSAVERLMSFFYFWSVGNDDAMLNLTPPSWRAQQDNPAGALFQKLSIRVPQDDYEVSSITGTEADALRTATVKVTIDKKDGRSKMDRYAMKVLLKKEDGVWYVDPSSLGTYEKETATETASNVNTTPTQPPLYTGTPATVLYYNANGGSMYHLDPDCPSVGKKYKPMASFMFVDLDQAPYNALRPCNQCGAPIPDD